MNTQLIYSAIDAARDLILGAEAWIYRHPETGYKEWSTQKYLIEKYEDLGYKPNCAQNIPGFYVDIDTGRPGPRVLVFGEMDSVICASHPDCDPETGAVHACGHNAQSAALLGIASALRVPGMLDGLSGSIRLCAAPAEELLELKYREELRQRGVISYYGGKTELMHRGFFDDCDIAFMFHTGGGKGFGCGKGQNGCMLKNIEYTGVAAHAGGAPHRGVNALYAANLGLSAINALRETFRDDDHIRVHPIVTEGGTAVNTIPDKVTLESYVRASSLEAMLRENIKVNRALAASAAALGANVNICDRPGYAPVSNDPLLKELACRLMGSVPGVETSSNTEEWSTGSTDMGDISSVMPAIHPHIG